MLNILAIAIAAIISLLVIAALRPGNFRISRSLEINAPAERIFPLIEDFSQWPRWSPWEKLDPALQRAVSSNPRGAGATYSWVGNNKVGQGAMKITEAKPNSLVAIDLSFIKPMKAENDVNFTLEPSSHGTLVGWSMDGTQPFIGKLMGLFMNMDKLVGGQFEEGLANLKRIAEQMPAPAAEKPAAAGKKAASVKPKPRPTVQ